MLCFICETPIESDDRGIITESTGQTGPPSKKMVFAHDACWNDWVARAPEAQETT
jgi:hypothetical protein